MKNGAFDPYFESSLLKIFERWDAPPKKDELTITLSGVVLSALYYNADATLKMLDQSGRTEVFFSETFRLAKHTRHSYQRKLFIFGLSCCLKASCACLRAKLLGGDRHANLLNACAPQNRWYVSPSF